MRERRYTATDVRGQEGKIRGTASVTYDGTPATEFEMWEGVVERIAPGAFDDALKSNPDVVALFNHDANLILGRTPDTLKLRADDKGLHYEIDPPDTQVARDLLVSIQRGDVRGSSFAFAAQQVEWTQEGNRDVRNIQRAMLFDCSPVTTPAYGGTSVGVRSEERKRLECEREEHRNRHETEKRMSRLKEIEDDVNR